MNKIGALLLLAITATILAGCVGSVSAAPHQITVVVTQIVEKIITATPDPIPSATPTPLFTATPEVSPTPDTLMLVPEGFNPWCSKVNDKQQMEAYALNGEIPEKALVSTFNEEQRELIIEVYSCTFAFTFNRAAPVPLSLSVYSKKGNLQKSFLLNVITNDPTTVYATITDTFITNPNAWFIDYRFVVTDASQSEIASETVRLKRGWFPGVCYQNALPDPTTLKCPPIGEGHPWDPWYGWDDPKMP